MDDRFPTEDARRLVRMALEEDFGEAGDLSSRLTLSSGDRTSAKLISKATGVLAGLPIFPLLFDELGGEVEYTLFKQDGDRVKPGEIVAELNGPVIALLGGERTLLNFVQQLSGVATAAALYVAETAGTECRILDTRKTIPGWRTLQKYAVRCGGALNHRIGLFDMIMLKDNHIAACGGVEAALERVFRTKPKEIPVEVEAETLEQIEAVLPFPVDRIMLDNMDLETMKRAVQRIRRAGHPAQIEASGNMTLDRIASVAATGVDLISIGALTHTVSALDLSMRFA